jgi:Methyltransferase domain
LSDETSARIYIPPDNRPARLVGVSVPMWADEICQMSFGERAALEGILSQRKPRLAIETGTYEGGSLRFLAAHCEQVHTFDLYDLVDDREGLGNVTFHTGDSKVLLPELLRDLEAEGSDVDFALVDGDHSADGVFQDLANLLDSPATRSTLILLHDTMNEETRSGIERVGLSDRAKVVYHELDFVAGYEFVGGHFDGETWGGLGLVITGDRSLPGYGEHSGQTRYRKPFELMHQARSLRGALDDALLELELSRRSLAEVHSSRSWRLTAPLRRAKHHLASRRART